MKYATKFDNEKMARAQAVGLPISLKQSAEICSFIRNRKYSVALQLLEKVTEMKVAVPYHKFNRGGTGHRKGMGAGRYPIKATGYIIKLLKSVHSNASNKGLDVSNLVIKAALVKQGARTPRYGRKRGRTAKRTHIELVVMQGAVAKKVETKKDSVKKAEAPSAQKKPEVKKAEPVSAAKKPGVKKQETKPITPQKQATTTVAKNIPTQADKK